MRKVFKYIASLDKKYALSFIFGIVIGGIGIYASFFFDRIPKISYEILSNSNVIDVHTELSKLDIIYDNVSIKKSDRNLRIITMRILNSGRKSITTQEYAQNEPLGIRIINGKIIEKPELLLTSDDYIKRNLSFNYDDSLDYIEFSKIIFDPKQYFTFKLLVLHDKNTIPEIEAIGKVAGMKNPKIIVTENNEKNRPLLLKITLGILNFIGKAFFYLILFAIIVVIIVVPFTLISDSRKKKKRKKLTHAFKEEDLYDDNIKDTYDYIFKSYISWGKNEISNYKKILNEISILDRLIPVISHTSIIDKRLFGQLNRAGDSSQRPNDELDDDLENLDIIEKLISANFIILEKNSYHIDKNNYKGLTNFLFFITGRD